MALFGTRFPIVLAPMVGASGGRLAGAVARAGGLGLIGVGHERSMAPEMLVREYETAKAMCGTAGSVGLGFTVGQLKGQDASFQKALVLKPKPSVIWLSFGSISEYTPLIAAARNAGISVMVMVQSAPEALEVASLGVDALVLQSGDAGGHGTQDSSPSYTSMIPEVKEALSAKVPLLAAGGVVGGDGLAAALCVGASGVVIGTRFSGCEESLLSTDKKKKLIACSTGADSVVSFSWDLFNKNTYPDGIHARAIRNECYRRYHIPIGTDQKVLSKEDKEWFANHGLESAPTYAGASVARIKAIDSAEEVIPEIMREAQESLSSSLKQVQKLLG